VTHVDGSFSALNYSTGPGSPSVVRLPVSVRQGERTVFKRPLAAHYRAPDQYANSGFQRTDEFQERSRYRSWLTNPYISGALVQHRETSPGYVYSSTMTPRGEVSEQRRSEFRLRDKAGGIPSVLPSDQRLSSCGRALKRGTIDWDAAAMTLRLPVEIAVSGRLLR
jgi:hypothetical protein